MPRGVYQRKNKPTKAPKATKAPKNFNEPPKTLRLDEMTMLRLARADAEMRASSSEVLIKKGVKEGLLQKVDPQGILKKLDLDIQTLTARYHQNQMTYEKVREEVGKTLGIDMKNYSYDDETGVLHDLSDTAAPPVEESLPTEKA
jgi:predicted dinucleotide-binding enzyme